MLTYGRTFSPVGDREARRFGARESLAKTQTWRAGLLMSLGVAIPQHFEPVTAPNVAGGPLERLGVAIARNHSAGLRYFGKITSESRTIGRFAMKSASCSQM